MSDILTEQEARDLCERILSQVTAPQGEVRVRSPRYGNARFALNRLTTSGEVDNVEATVIARYGQRSAAVAFNTLADEGIGAAVARAQSLAEIAPEDPEQMPLITQQNYSPVPAFFENTAALTAADRADAVLAATQPAQRASLEGSGFLEHTAEARAIANTAGLFAYHRSTHASFTTTVRTPDGTASGWAGGAHNDWGRVGPPAELAAHAVEKAQGSTQPAALEPGVYTVVLEPTAVGNLIQLLWSALDARPADEGRSFFSRRGGGNKIGQQVVDARVTLLSDPQDPDLLTAPFTDEGQPVGRTVWIENGGLRNLAYTRFWAEKQGRAPVPRAGGIKMLGGQGSAADLVTSVKRGLLITRFWYIRSVDPRTLLHTGLTRDGTFLIENGRVTGAVKNLRFNESPVGMLNHVIALGAPVPVVASEAGGLGTAVVVPPIVTREFRFTSVSDAV